MPLISDAPVAGVLARVRARLATSLATAPAPTTATKASRTGPLVAYGTLGQPVWSPRDYGAFAREGFMQNPIAYRCVRMIAEAAASIPLLLYDRDIELEDHPFLALLARPSHDHTGKDFLETWVGFLLVSGNAYVEAVAVGGELRELHALRPDRMQVIPGPDGWPEAYDYTVAGQSVRFSAEPLPGVRPILHTRLFHPLSDHYGMSPIEAAATAIDIHNAASGWNKALLDNSARPSGALVYAAKDGHLTGEQFERLKAELETGFQGARNAGRPLLLEGGLDWKPLSLTPKDMDFIEAKHAAAREIALALGVPPMLLGIPGDNTYSNYQEASRTFWRQTVLPLVTRFSAAVSAWLSPAYGAASLRLVPDLDAIEALAPERDALWTRLDKSTFLTRNEKRLAAGYPALDGGDRLAQKFNPSHDALGRFTFGPGGARTPAGTPVEPSASRPRNPGNSGHDPEEDRRYSVSLVEQDPALGGHTIRDHVGKPDQYLLDYVKERTLNFGVIRYEQNAEGSFASTEAANDIVNQTLKRNRDRVDEVVSGARYEAVLNERFGFVTGKEAYRLDPDTEPYMRPTYAARVVIQHDSRSDNGYRVLTAFPVNQRPERQ